MSTARGFDPLLKEILLACADLPRARPAERKVFWQAMDGWQTQLDNLALAARVGASVQPMGGRGVRGPDPREEARPEEARLALMGLHFGRPQRVGTPAERFRADLDYLCLRIEGSDALAVDVSTRERMEKVKTKTDAARGAVPTEVNILMMGLLVRCYRALQEDSARGDAGEG